MNMDILAKNFNREIMAELYFKIKIDVHYIIDRILEVSVIVYFIVNFIAKNEVILDKIWFVVSIKKEMAKHIFILINYSVTAKVLV